MSELENNQNNNVQKQFELSKEQKEELKEAFEVFDADGDGHIDAHELQIVLEAVGRKMSIEEVGEAIKKVDDSGDGEIEFEEFLKLMTDEMGNSANDEELIEAFKFYGATSDRDSISKEQLGAKLKGEGIHLSDEDLNMLFTETCVSRSNGIQFSDFMLMMMPK